MADQKKTQNRFAAMAADDSDDDVQVKPATKTQKKKEERKVNINTEAKAPKINVGKMAEGGFDVVDKTRQPQGQRGGRGGGRGGGEGGRGGGRGGGFRGGGRGGRGGGDFRPKTAQPRLDADGNPLKDFKGQRGHQEYRGKPRQEDHPYDRKDGTGRGRKPNPKGGAGRANWGEKEGVQYKKKDEETIQKTEDDAIKPVEEKKEEKKEEYTEEIIGVSLDDFFKDKNFIGKQAGRATEGIKGEKVLNNEAVKEKQSTTVANQYMKTVHAKTADANNNMMGFGNAPDDEDRGGAVNVRGRGGRKGGAGRDSIVNQGSKRQNARQALKKTEEDFPTL